MKPLVRLLDDPTLSAAARADLDLVARNPYQPDLEKAGRALAAALAAELATAEPALQVPAAKGTGAQSASSSLAPALKWTLVALGGAAVLAVPIWRADLLPTSRRAARPAAAAEPAPLTAAVTGVRPVPTIAPQPPATSTVVAPAAPSELPAAAESTPRTAAPASRREIAQLLRIQTLLAREPARAYRLARASQREFPDGPLRQEREGLAVLALWQLGDHTRARSVAGTFLARYPESPLSQRLRALLAAEPVQ